MSFMAKYKIGDKVLYRESPHPFLVNEGEIVAIIKKDYLDYNIYKIKVFDTPSVEDVFSEVSERYIMNRK